MPIAAPSRSSSAQEYEAVREKIAAGVGLSSLSSSSSQRVLSLQPEDSSFAMTSGSSMPSSPASSSAVSRPSSVVSSQYEERRSMLPALPPDRAQALINFVDHSVVDAYNLCHSFGRIRWSQSKSREGVSICRGVSENDTRLDAAVRGSCNVTATFQEMMDLLITESTDEFINHESSINPTEFLDGQLLHTLVPRTPDDRFICVKWHCIKSLAPSVAKHRDYVYVEIVDHFENEEGVKVGYRLSKSIDLDEFRSSDAVQMLVRGKTLTLQTFAEPTPGNLELYTMMINDLGERLPTWLVHKIVDTAAMRTACIRDFINHKRIDLLVFANPKDMVPLSKRVCCVVCTKSFSLVRKKYNCVACGDVICNQCSVHHLLTSPGISEFVGRRKARICVKCSSGLNQNVPRRKSMRNSDLQVGSAVRNSAGSNMRGRHSTDKTTDLNARNRMLRSASAVDSQSSTLMSSSLSATMLSTSSSSIGDDLINVTASRPSVPMFKVRLTAATKPTDRESGKTASSSSPDESVMGDDMEFANFLDESALTASQSEDETVNKVRQLESELAVESFLMSENANASVAPAVEHVITDDEAPVIHVVERKSFKQSRRSTPPSIPGQRQRTSINAPMSTVEELTIEEVVPMNRASSLSTLSRQSISFGSDGLPETRPSSLSSNGPGVAELSEEVEVSIVKPVVIRKASRLSIGGGGRKSREHAAPPPIPPTRTEPSEASTASMDPVPEKDQAEEGSDESHIQLSDLQVHLDKMKSISDNLKSLKIEAKTQPSAAMAHLASYETKANAEAAAKIAAGFISLLERGSFATNERIYHEAAVVRPPAVVPFLYGDYPTELDVTLAIGDGGIVTYLADSSFSELSETVDESSSVGWQTVYSKTIGKLYYYNERWALTSWTPPTPDCFGTAVYMVL